MCRPANLSRDIDDNFRKGDRLLCIGDTRVTVEISLTGDEQVSTLKQSPERWRHGRDPHVIRGETRDSVGTAPVASEQYQRTDASQHIACVVNGRRE